MNDNDYRAVIADLKQQRDGLVRLARFMADRLDSFEFPRYAPASWSYIVKEARVLGIELERR